MNRAFLIMNKEECVLFRFRLTFSTTDRSAKIAGFLYASVAKGRR